MDGGGGATGAGPGGAALRNMENHEAYSILDELQKDGKIEADNADEAKEKFYKLHEALVINMENEHVLMKRSSLSNVTVNMCAHGVSRLHTHAYRQAFFRLGRLKVTLVLFFYFRSGSDFSCYYRTQCH